MVADLQMVELVRDDGVDTARRAWTRSMFSTCLPSVVQLPQPLREVAVGEDRLGSRVGPVAQDGDPIRAGHREVEFAIAVDVRRRQPGHDA